MPALKVKVGGSLANPISVKAKVGGVLTTAIAVWVKVGGALVKVWPLGVSVSPSSTTKEANRPATLSTLLTASGGSGSYNWSIVSGGASMTLSPSTGTTSTISSTATSGTTTLVRTCTVRCADATNGAIFFDVPVSFTFHGTG